MKLFNRGGIPGVSWQILPNLQGFLSQELLSSREMSKDESPSPGPMESNGVMDRRQDFWGFMLIQPEQRWV
jgi:hypothetical protein